MHDTSTDAEIIRSAASTWFNHSLTLFETGIVRTGPRPARGGPHNRYSHNQGSDLYGIRYLFFDLFGVLSSHLCVLSKKLLPHTAAKTERGNRSKKYHEFHRNPSPADYSACILNVLNSAVVRYYTCRLALAV